MIESLTPAEWARLPLLYAHVIASMLAVARVLSADLGLVTGRLGRDALHGAVRDIARLLVALWITGLAIVWLDTGFAPTELAARPKLLLKLAVVSALTANGAVLHRASFPVLLSDRPPGPGASLLLSTTGALSTMHWLLAAFIGIAGPLDRVPLGELLRVYALLFAATVGVSACCMPMVRRRVLGWRRSSDPALKLDIGL